MHSLVWRTGKRVGATTWHANHSSGRPGSDTGSSRQKAIEASKAARARHGEEQRQATSNIKTPAMGGHVVVQVGAIWQCLICKEWSRSRAKLETKKCKGAVARKWWCKAASSILEEVENPAIQASKQHRRMYSGDIIWCSVCGCYGEHKARGLTAICEGKFEGIWKGGGRVAQLRSLKANSHPRTGKLIPPAVPESQWLAG